MTKGKALTIGGIAVAVVVTVVTLRTQRELPDAALASFSIQPGDEQRVLLRHGILQAGGKCGYIDRSHLGWTDPRTGEQLWYITCRGGESFAVTLNGNFTAAIECKALEKMGGSCFLKR